MPWFEFPQKQCLRHELECSLLVSDSMKQEWGTGEHETGQREKLPNCARLSCYCDGNWGSGATEQAYEVSLWLRLAHLSNNPICSWVLVDYWLRVINLAMSTQCWKAGWAAFSISEKKKNPVQKTEEEMRWNPDNRFQTAPMTCQNWRTGSKQIKGMPQQIFWCSPTQHLGMGIAFPLAFWGSELLEIPWVCHWVLMEAGLSMEDMARLFWS